ncbi:DUF805 domain-containing protein [Actinomadura sp. NEAU-AAG7]|uniref:DUF805 domain-containing protein n=1 Tax=Actinomadura sp. NEAU-AAG7 TaxID=2839640 RepID=UPI001BE4CAB6|nr:DUF805 domain-containing protein [Actinomadura sp. NEAU-AAG7]MBT2210337.1 DUF805 domain-containing protein [Actinomadura sp. NEAU-AAG7]
MDMRTSVERTFVRSFDWSGRASRSEYWWFYLFSMVILAVAYTLAFTVASLFTPLIWILLSLVPSLGVSVRRLHDTDRSGWWLLLALVPYIGAFVVLVFTCLPSTPGHNGYGPPDDAAAQANVHRRLARQVDKYGDIYVAVGYAALAVVYAGEAGKKADDDLTWLSLRREVMGDQAFRQRLLEVLDEGGTDDLVRLTNPPPLGPAAHTVSDPPEGAV